MGNISDYVTISITANTVGLTRAGFGTPLILSATATFTPRVQFYADLASVAVDFPTTTSAEYLAAAAMFSQNPAPPLIAIGRSVNKPTCTAQISAINPTSNVSYTYSITVRGKGFADTTVTYTSDATPTDAEYAAGIVAALNGVASKNYTAAGAASPVTVTGTNPGDWFSIEIADPSTQKVSYTHADPGVAADLAAINLENASWYTLYTLYNSKPYAIAAAAWIESAGMKTYLCESNDTNSIITATGNAELLDTIKTNAYTRTTGWYHPSPANMLGAALLGKCLPLDPGAVVLYGKTLAGPAPVKLTSTHRTNLVARRAGSYETVAGLNVTFGGQVGDSVTNFFDVRRDLDWIQDDMSKAVFAVITSQNAKVGYTDAGIAAVESEIRGSLKRAQDRGILDPTVAPVVTVPTAASISGATKATRVLPNCKFSATMAGAIQGVTLVGTTS